jgi:undecaprenyl-diphosphatase
MTWLLSADYALRAWVVAHRIWWLDGAMWTLSTVGRVGLVWFIPGAVSARRTGRWRMFLMLVVAVLLAWIVADMVLKPAVGRHRPFIRTPAVRVIGGKPHDASFPSAHAAGAFAAAVVLSMMMERLRIFWWLLAALMAYSRVYVGVHYPLDVLAGAVLGVAIGISVVAMIDRTSPKKIRGGKPR